jgi:SAM-dependent methyltransferase
VDHAKLYDEHYFDEYRPGTGGTAFRQRSEMYRQEYRRITRYVQSGRVLDVGAGLGDFLELFEAERWDRYGIEIAPFALEILRSRGIKTEMPADADDFFDLVIFRGTLQHLDEPFATLKRCIRWLRPGGYMVFLATPNIGGVCYRLFQELPALDPPRNFMLISDKILRQILENLGMEVVRFEFPYVGTPYAHPARDVLYFVLRLFGVRHTFAFWGNMLECYARKPERSGDDCLRATGSDGGSHELLDSACGILAHTLVN